MQKIWKSAAILLMAASALILSSCKGKEPVPEEPTYADEPFTTLYVTADGERVLAETDHAAKALTVKFDKAKHFSSVSIQVNINEGWSCTYPEDLNAANLAEFPVIQFKSPKNATLRYFFTVTSNALPIADASKISVSGIKGTVSVNQDAQLITIQVSPDAIKGWKEIPPVGYGLADAMDEVLGHVKLEFGQGALMEGASVTGSSEFNFFNSYKKTLIINSNGSQTSFDVVLNMSGLMGNPSAFGFSDVSDGFVPEGSGIQVLSATTIPNVPIRNYRYNGQQFPETPFTWDWSSEVENLGPAHAFVFGVCGDWALDRETETFTPTELAAAYVVYIDPDQYKAKMYNAADNQVGFLTGKSFINVSAASPLDDVVLFNDGKLYNDRYVELGSSILDAGANGTNSTVGITADGRIEIANAYYDGAKWRKYYHDICWDSNEPYSENLSRFSEWNVTAAATAYPWLFRNGHAATCWEMVCTDGRHWEICYGQGWNGMRSRVFVGRTFDGRTGIAVFNGTPDTPTPPYQYGIGSAQGEYVLRQLGWMDVAQIGTAFYKDSSLQFALSINGKLVCGDASLISAYVLGFDKR